MSITVKTRDLWLTAACELARGKIISAVPGKNMYDCKVTIELPDDATVIDAFNDRTLTVNLWQFSKQLGETRAFFQAVDKTRREYTAKEHGRDD